jgi:hypothetical protein
LELLLQKEYAKPGILILPWREDSLKRYYWLIQIRLFFFIADIYGGELSKDNAEAGKSAGYYKTNYKAPKRIALALEQLVKSGANQIIL